MPNHHGVGDKDCNVVDTCDQMASTSFLVISIHSMALLIIFIMLKTEDCISDHKTVILTLIFNIF